LFEIFKDAVQREREAQATYKLAADLCEDKDLKKLLMGIRRDEIRHEKTLLARCNRFARKSGIWS